MTRTLPFALILLIVLVTLPTSASAQLFGEHADRADWALEASLFGNYTNFDFDQVNKHLNDGPGFYVTERGYAAYSEQETLEDGVMTYDIRLGGRWRSVHFGGGYANIPEMSGGYLLTGGPGGNEARYDVAFKAREYYGYAGYLHPFNDMFSAGVMLALGFGVAEGTVTDDIHGADSASMDGTYSPWRLEARGRINLTTYVSIDLGVGIRNANVTDMEADFGVDGVYGIDGSSGPLQDYNDAPMDFDFTGWYIGGGITLLNPFEDQ